jgi:hypothetical protein
VLSAISWKADRALEQLGQRSTEHATRGMPNFSGEGAGRGQDNEALFLKLLDFAGIELCCGDLAHRASRPVCLYVVPAKWPYPATTFHAIGIAPDFPLPAQAEMRKGAWPPDRAPFSVSATLSDLPVRLRYRITGLARLVGCWSTATHEALAFAEIRIVDGQPWHLASGLAQIG